jgi:hypothetical protein
VGRQAMAKTIIGEELEVIQDIYNGLLGIKDGLSFQDSKIAEVIHLMDAIDELIYKVTGTFDIEERK